MMEGASCSVLDGQRGDKLLEIIDQDFHILENYSISCD